MGDLRLSPEVEAALRVAAEHARRARSVSVEPLHVVAALLERDGPGAALFASHGHDLVELRTVVAHAIAAQPPMASSYRDGPLPRASSLEALLVRAGASGFWARVRPMRLDALVAALVADPSTSHTIDGARVTAPFEGLVARASALAAARGNAVVTPAHVVVAALEQGVCRSRVEAWDLDPDAIVAAVRAALDPGADAVRGTELGREVREIERLLDHGHSPALLLRTAVARAVARPSVAQALRAAHMEPTLVMSALLHELPDRKWTADETAELDIVFHDDPITTMEVVVLVLTEDLGMTRDDAIATMLAVHKEGEATVATARADVAREKVAAILARARREGAPLLVTTRPVP